MFKLNVIEPHLLETNGEERFSINDVETVERLFRKAREDDAQTQAAPTVEAPPSQEERDPDARDRRRALQDYLESGKSPCDLPVWFWEIPDPIPFVPPLDVFRYEYAARRFDEKPRDFITHIKRSAGYSRNNEGKVVRVLEDPAFSVELDQASVPPSSSTRTSCTSWRGKTGTSKSGCTAWGQAATPSAPLSRGIRPGSDPSQPTPVKHPVRVVSLASARAFLVTGRALS